MAICYVDIVSTDIGFWTYLVEDCSSGFFATVTAQPNLALGDCSNPTGPGCHASLPFSFEKASPSDSVSHAIHDDVLQDGSLSEVNINDSVAEIIDIPAISFVLNGVTKHAIICTSRIRGDRYVGFGYEVKKFKDGVAPSERLTAVQSPSNSIAFVHRGSMSYGIRMINKS